MASTRSTIDLVIRGSLSGLTGAVGAAKAELDALRQRAETLAPVGERAGRALALLSKAMLGLAAAGAAVHTIVGLAGALANLLPLALAIPGALLSLGAVFATLKIGLSGVGDAIKSGDISKLAPEAGKAVTAIRSLSGEFDKLKKSVQNALFKDLADGIKQVGSQLLPILSKGLTGIAEQLNKVSKGFIEAFKSPAAQGDLRRILDSTKKSLDGLGPAATSVTKAFVQLGAFGARQFEGLGKSIQKLALQFETFVSKGVNTGSFQKAFDNAKATLNDLLAVVKNVGSSVVSIFAGLSSGMAGGSFLAVLRETTAELDRFLKTAASQDGLRAFGEVLAAAAKAVQDVFLAALKQLLPIIRDLSPFVAECARVFGTLLVNALNIVGPILQSVAKFLGDHKEIAQVLIPLIAGLALKFALLKVGTAVITSLASLSTALGGIRGLGLVALAAGIAAVAVEIDKLNVATAPNGDTEQSGGLADTLHNIVEAGKQLASGDFSGIMAKIRDEVNQTSATWTAGQAPIQQWFDKVRTSFSSDLLAPMEAFGAKVNEIIGGVIQAMTDFGTNVNGIIAGVIQAMTDFGTNVNAAIDGVIAKMNEFGAFVNGIIAGVIQAMTDFGTNVNAAIQTVIDKMNEFGAFVNGIIAQVIAAMTNFGAGVNAAIDNAIQAFVRFVTEVANNVNQAIAFIATLPGRAAAALASLGALIVGVANQAWSAFLGAVRSGTDAVVGFVRGIPGMISSAIGNLGSILVNAGRSLMDGLLSGIRAGLEAVLSFARTIAAQIAAVKGPIPKDRKTLVPAGLALMHGLLDGLKTGNRDVQAFVGTIADQIAQSASGGGLIATAGKFAAATGGTGGAGSGAGGGITSTSAPLPVTIPIHIGDEVVRVVRTEIDTSNRDVRRTVRAGAGVTAG